MKLTCTIPESLKHAERQTLDYRLCVGVDILSGHSNTGVVFNWTNNTFGGTCV